VTGEVRRGRVAPAGRAHLRAWLARFAGRDDVAFAVEGCAGWRYVAEELAAAGVVAHLAEPADTAAGRGRKRRAKTGKTGARHLRMLLAEGRPPECWIPPEHILEDRALLETYHDLRREHTAWVQRIHAVFFHQGAPRLGEDALRGEQGVAKLRAAAAAHLSPVGQLQVATALDMLEAVEARMDVLRKQLREAARHLTGARVLAARLYGAGPVTGLALTCWLAGKDRFSSSRKAVRFTGLDITVHSSDRKGPPGRLSRQGPPVLRWAVYEAGKAHARSSAPTMPAMPRSRTARTVSAPPCPRPARSSVRRCTSWPGSATTPSPPPELHRFHGDHAPRHPGPGGARGSHTHRMGTTAASSCRSAVSRCRPVRAQQWPGGRPD
jgi:transposase